MAAVVLTMQVSREPRHEGYADLGGPNSPGDDFRILVDGKPIGETYWCSAGDIKAGERWGSWGPAGLSLGHPDRDASERVQVRAYALNPDVTDRWIAEQEAKKKAAAERRRVAREAEAQRQRIEREGDDAPGPTVWTLPAWHALFGQLHDVAAVARWLSVNGLDGVVSGTHEIRVERRVNRRVIVHERPHPASRGEWTQTWVTTCVQDPPDVDLTPRPDLVALIEAGHRPTQFPLIDFGQQLACAACTKASKSRTAVVAWECPVFASARDGGVR